MLFYTSATINFVSIYLYSVLLVIVRKIRGCHFLFHSINISPRDRLNRDAGGVEPHGTVWSSMKTIALRLILRTEKAGCYA